MKTMIAVPCMDTMATEFVKSLVFLRPVGEVCHSFTVSTLCDIARNTLAKQAAMSDCDRVLWLDSDMVFTPDLLERLSDDMEGREFVCGLYSTRKQPYHPTIYKEISVVKTESGLMPKASVYDDYPKDSVFRVCAAGFGAVLMTTDLIRKVGERFGLPFERVTGFGEDLSFCMRVAEMGIPMYCDSRIKLGHLALNPIEVE